MKKMICFVAFLCALTAMASADVIKLAADAFCPYNCGSFNPEPGFIVEAATIIFKKAGHQVEYQEIPYEQALQGTLDGYFSGLIGVLHAAAPELVFPTEDFGTFKNIILTKKDFAWKYTGIDSLKNVLILAVKNYKYGEPLDGYIATNQGDPTKVMFMNGLFGVQQAFRMLESVDNVVFIDDLSAINYQLRIDGKMNAFTQIPLNLPDLPIYIGFSPRNPKSKQYAIILSAGIVEMKQSGEWDKLKQHYQIAK